jgi:cytochrome c5
MKSYLTIVTLCFVLFIVVFVGSHLDTPGRAEQDRSTLLGGGSGVGDRVAAIGQINVAVAEEESTSDEAEVASTEVTPTTPPAADGKQVYDAGCVACHGAGIAGAPRVGDSDAWTDRIGAGLENMVANAVNGFQGSQGMMPAKGGNPSLSDEEIEAAVEYMVAGSQ